MNTVKFRLFFDFTRRDWSTTLIPGLIIATDAVKCTSVPARDVIVGVEEDRINKPDRPLPSGKITVQGAKRRWAIALVAFAATALFNGNGHLIIETATWVTTTALLWLTPYGGHWFGRNSVIMGTSQRHIQDGCDTRVDAERFFFVVAIWLATAIQIQDLRDVEGDTIVSNRRKGRHYQSWLGIGKVDG